MAPTIRILDDLLGETIAPRRFVAVHTTQYAEISAKLAERPDLDARIKLFASDLVTPGTAITFPDPETYTTFGLSAVVGPEQGPPEPPGWRITCAGCEMTQWVAPETDPRNVEFSFHKLKVGNRPESWLAVCPCGHGTEITFD